MTANEIEAILAYTEFNLLKMVEDLEPHITDPDVVGEMYDRAYSVLSDLEVTFSTQHLLDQQEKVAK